MIKHKAIIKHVLLRILAFPLLAVLIYLIISTLSSGEAANNWTKAFFAAAAMGSITLMAEIILLFRKNKIKKLVSDLALILIILLIVLFLVPAPTP